MINFTVGPVQSSEVVREIGAENVPYFRTAEFSAVMLENERLGKKFKEIKVSEEGLEMIESISVDCTRKTGAWHSDTEILIDKFGFVRLNGTKTNKYWNGTIACSKKPLRLRLRNICGDEMVIGL